MLPLVGSLAYFVILHSPPFMLCQLINYCFFASWFPGSTCHWSHEREAEKLEEREVFWLSCSGLLFLPVSNHPSSAPWLWQWQLIIAVEFSISFFQHSYKQAHWDDLDDLDVRTILLAAVLQDLNLCSMRSFLRGLQISTKHEVSPPWKLGDTLVPQSSSFGPLNLNNFNLFSVSSA